eukprot:15364506-Ditylum_brightwellii.AAC.2
MEEIANRSRILENTPPMTLPVVDLLGYNSNTDYADRILLGTADPIFDIDENIQLYLDQLAAVKGALLEEAKSDPFSQYIQEVENLREKTSSGPSNITPSMIKTEIGDPCIANVNWNASNFPWCTRYSPNRFRNRVYWTRPTLLFNLEANIQNKRLGKEVMQHAEEYPGLAIKQYGSRKFKSADLQVLNIRLFYNYALLKRTPTTRLFIDLVSNYDFVVHNIASLALQRVGMPKAPILCTFKMLQDMIHTVRTVYVDSI